jgi:hypothetical protein
VILFYTSSVPSLTPQFLEHFPFAHHMDPVSIQRGGARKVELVTRNKASRPSPSCARSNQQTCGETGGKAANLGHLAARPS